MPANGRPRIALLASAETASSVLYGLYDVLWTAGAVFPELTTGEAGEPVLDVQIVAADAEPFRCTGDILVEPHAGLAEIDAPDVAVICDMYVPIDVSPRHRYPREIAWLKEIHGKGTTIAAVCSGTLVLAETGLLNGLPAAGHWAYRHLSRDYFPKVRWREDSILCLAGDDQRLVTTGGVTSWQDLALYLIARFSGPRHAVETAKVHLLSNHEDGQLPFAAMTRKAQHSDAAIGNCQVWIADNYDQSNPVARMANRAGLKPRTFARRFRAATGYQPMDYVHALRIEEAKQLLETERANIEEIGARVGYEDAASFRRLFKRKAGLTPAAYRRKFADIASPAGIA